DGVRHRCVMGGKGAPAAARGRYGPVRVSRSRSPLVTIDAGNRSVISPGPPFPESVPDPRPRGPSPVRKGTLPLYVRRAVLRGVRVRVPPLQNGCRAADPVATGSGWKTAVFQPEPVAAKRPLRTRTGPTHREWRWQQGILWRQGFGSPV